MPGRWCHLEIWPVFIAATLAVPQSTTIADLPAQLAGFVPICAQSCVAASIATNWPRLTAASSEDLHYLCANKSVSGLSLGEIALECMAGACPSATSRNDSISEEVYHVCSDQFDAQPNTHSTLTATFPFASTASARAAVHSRGDDDDDDFKLRRLVNELVYYSRLKPSLGFGIEPGGPFHINDTSALPDHRASVKTERFKLRRLVNELVYYSRLKPSLGFGPVSKPSAQLSGLQIALVAVAGFVSVSIVAAGMTACYLQRGARRRRQRNGDRDGFNVLGSPRLDLGERGFKRPRTEKVAEPSASHHRAGECHEPSEGRATAPLSAAPSPDIPAEEIGIAISPDTKEVEQAAAPPGTARGPFPPRISSKLLPDKPVYRPTPAVSVPAPEPARPFSEATEIEDDGGEIDGEGEGAGGGRSDFRRGSSASSFDWATAYYMRDIDPNEHLRGFQYARELSILTGAGAQPLSRSAETGHYRSQASKRVTRLTASSVYSGSPTTPTAHDGRRRVTDRTRGSEGYSQARPPDFPRPPWKTQAKAPPSSSSHHLRPAQGRNNNNNDDEDVNNTAPSPISPSRLHYPTIPRCLSSRPPPNQPRRTEPAKPPLLRNDTYARNEDLLIATTQALSRATSSAAEWSATLAQEDVRQTAFDRLHLGVEVERAQQAKQLMHEREKQGRAGLPLSMRTANVGVSGGGGDTRHPQRMAPVQQQQQQRPRPATGSRAGPPSAARSRPVPSRPNLRLVTQ
ncbi:MAG: hypothetical protein M1826_004286 [Phylliscum demangeonii]|nr:MAG: hypothetical protein M1826_004286 [Phylliscum demangeonii]